MKSFKENLKDWFLKSQRVLQSRTDLEKELFKREFLKDHSEENKTFFITNVNVCGTYNVVGGNPDSEDSYYSGLLNIELDESQIVASWLIEGSQHHAGYGFVFNNTLIISFDYMVGELLYSGVVAYHFLTPEIVIGKWTEEVADTNTFEMARKLSPEELGAPNPDDFYNVN